MEILGVGPLEILLIFIIALVVLGPRDMVKAGRSFGRLLRKTVLSPTWLNMQREIRKLPYQMMREAGLEEEDLRINVKRDIEEAYRRNPAKPYNFVTKDKQAELAHNTPEMMDEQLPTIPPEWLGVPTTAFSSNEEETFKRKKPSLEDWTSAPVTVASEQDLQQDEDAD
jgi:hypothetical protein